MDKYSQDLSRAFDTAIDNQVRSAASLAQVKSSFILKMTMALGNQMEVPASMAIEISQSYLNALSEGFYEALKKLAKTNSLPAVDPAVEARYLIEKGDELIADYVQLLKMGKEKLLRERREAGVVTRKNQVH